jgi:DNA-binding GntR family transcriptional regulator
MLNAIQGKDLNALKKALKDHINNVKARIQTLLEERGGKI